MTIDILPDDVLLEIFCFHEYVNDPLWYTGRQTWRSLVHVCRRWRHLVFASPRRLNLRLMYRAYRPMSELLDVWPALPVSLMSIIDHSYQRQDNTVAALESEQSTRICEINIGVITTWQWERISAAMQKSFPQLTRLRVWTNNMVQVLPDPFVGGSAPRLRTLVLEKTPFPSIPKLLLSANRLVELILLEIPDSGYFSPDAMATALAVLTRLEFLHFMFRFPRPRPDLASRPLPPPTRSVLPALTRLSFKGASWYLEDVLVRINIPRLHFLDIIYFMDLDFEVSQLYRLISHAEEFKTFDRANVSIYDHSILLSLDPTTAVVQCPVFDLAITCRGLGDQLSSLFQVCSSFFPFISALEELQIRDETSPSSHWEDDMENARWLELLHPFTALKNLYLANGIAQRLCDALQELSGERTTKVLPALRSLFVQGSSLERVQEAIKSFVTARQVSGHPVVVDRWKK